MPNVSIQIMKNNCNEVVFRKYCGNWIHPLILGFVILFLSYLIGHHLYYIYIYFFGVSALIITASFQKFSILKEDSILLYFGTPFSRKYIELKFSDIVNMEITKKQIRDGLFSGGWPIISYKEFDQLLIVLKNPIDSPLVDSLKKGGSSFSNQLKVGEHGNELLVASKPTIGYKKFINFLADRFSNSAIYLNNGKDKLKAC